MFPVEQGIEKFHFWGVGYTDAQDGEKSRAAECSGVSV
jgi:hypothetical protein